MYMFRLYDWFRISIGGAAGRYTAGGITFSPRSYPRMLRGVVVWLFFFECSSGYFLLRVKRRPAAPNPARMPMNGAGVDVCVCGGLTGETEGTPCVGSAVVVGTGVGSAVGWSQTEYP